MPPLLPREHTQSTTFLKMGNFYIPGRATLWPWPPPYEKIDNPPKTGYEGSMKKNLTVGALFLLASAWLWLSNEGAGISYDPPFSQAEAETDWELPQSSPPIPTPPVPQATQAPKVMPVPVSAVRPPAPKKAPPPARKASAPPPPPSGPAEPTPLPGKMKYLEQVEESWGAVTTHLFNERFGMGQEDYQEYLRLRNAFQTEKKVTLEERAAAGLTPEEERQIVESIRQRHHEDLRRQIGDDRFEDYRLTLSRFNQALRLQRAQSGGSVSSATIEF